MKIFDLRPFQNLQLTLVSLILLLISVNVYGQIDNPDWGDNATPCVTNALLYPGVGVVSNGVVEDVSVNSRYVVSYIALNNGLPTTSPFRDEITDPDSILHHSDWLVSNIGNVFGVAINQSTAEVFVTASSNYGAGYGNINNSPSVLNYGVEGSPANATEAAGTVYRIDPITGNTSVFVRLPQQSTTLQHWDCEDDAIEITRNNTGVGLGNIAYDELNNQYFVTNTEDGRIYRISSSGEILDSYDPLIYDDGAVGITDLEDVPYGIAVEPGSNRLFFGFVDDPGAGPSGSEALPGAPSIYSINLNASGGFVGTVNTTIMPSGASYLNYVGTDQLHGTIPTSILGGGFSYTNHTTYFISDLAFSPDGKLLVAVRSGCYGSWHSSYNHWAETDLITLNISNNLYDTAPFEYDISVNGFAGDEDAYGGVAIYDLNDGSCEVQFASSSADVLSDNGPHGIVIWQADTTNSPISPLGVFEYDVLPNEDPKGIGGDIEMYNGCSNSCNISGTTTACENDVVSLTYTPDCPSSIFTWKITSGNATISGVKDSTVIEIIAGSADFTASVILYGIPIPCTHDVTISALLNPVISSAGPFCVDNSPVNLNASPTGGVFSGTGITNTMYGTFDPASTGIGTHTITYTLPGICMESATTDIIVNDIPSLTLSGGAFCFNDPPINLSASPGGGTFSGSGITDSTAGTFDPAIAGVGTHAITYIYTDGNGCSNNITTDVVVYAFPVISVSGGAFCFNDPPGNLSASPTGGVFSGTGITDASAGTFDPAIAGPGNHKITYDYTDGNGCSNNASTNVTVYDIPPVFLIGDMFCIDDAQSNLTAGPGGGIFSGTGITDASTGTFDPLVAGVGTHSINYDYTDGNGCSNSISADVIVNALPDVNVSGGPYCLNDAPDNLIASPPGGTFSGSGITNTSAGTFDPAIAGLGTHVITYIYTDGNDCSNSATVDIVVNSFPDLDITGGPFCYNDAPGNLSVSPTGGVFSGSGIIDVSEGTFDPAVAGVGTHTITYDFTAGNGCSNTTTTNVVVFALPVISVSGGPFCIDDSSSNLTASPGGGTFSGPGIIDPMFGTFDPATAGEGTHTITYDYTDSNGCSNSTTTDVVVNALPVLSVSGGPFCIDDSASNLPASPGGGAFSGPGIIDPMFGTFDPAIAGVGIHSITYDYTDSNGCNNSTTTDLVVNALPIVSLTGGIFCLDDTPSNLSSSPTGGVFSGAGITDASAGTFDPATAGVGTHTITYDYTDGNGCSNSATADVIVNALPILSVSGGPFCIDDSPSNLPASPGGGTFSGPGIIDPMFGTFDPATAGEGTHTITYDYTDGNGCSNSTTTDVIVNGLPVLSLSGGPFCIDDSASNLLASPGGGTFSGPGIIDPMFGTFDPALAGLGTHTITYDYTDGNGCSNSATADIIVNALPIVNVSGGPFCVDDASSNLPSSPAGGIFSGTGITDSSAGTFDPTTAGVGTHTITYDYTDGNGCSNSATTDIVVNALPVVSVSGGPFCIDDAPSNISASPTGGVFSGTGITDSSAGTFDPSLAGAGTHTITYDYTDGNGCSNSATTDIVVNALPVVSVSGGPFCIDDAPSNLSASPTGGVFSGTGITDSSAGTFDPALAGVGTHTITYDYTDGNGCSNSATADIIVNALPIVNVSGGPFCVDDASSNLPSSPAGGIFSGTGITDSSAGTFDPTTAGVGNHTITYDYTDGNGCSNSATTDIVVNALPVVSLSGGPFCIDDAPSNISASPTGGVFSGTGITDSSAGTFDPTTAGVGTHTITYDYTDGNGCSNSATTDIVVNALPVVSVSGGPFCIDDAPSNLLASPTGGVFSGTGITDSSAGALDPALAGVGTHTITYDYTDGNGCSNSATTDIIVNALPIVNVSGGPFCVDDASSNLPSSPAGGIFSGTGITDSSAGTFDPTTAGVGNHTITYDYTDGNGCSNSATTDIVVNALPVVSLSGGPFCIDDAPSNLSASPTSGVFSGTGITDSSAGTFDPSLAGAGTHTITYDYTDGNGCSNNTTLEIVVYAIPIVTLSGGPFCFDDAPSNLSGSPTGGVFSGTGITDASAGTFDPSLAGVGTHTITYDYTDSNGCSNSATTDIVVNALPVVSVSGGPFCVDDIPSNLAASPSGGVFSGMGITDASAGTFDPAAAGVGSHTITYDYTDSNGCSNSSITDVVVNDLPNPVIDPVGMMGQVCIGNGTLSLSASPTGGVYSGTGITDASTGIFDPKEADMGTHTITYDYTDANGCSASTTLDIEVINCFDLALTKMMDPLGPQGPFVLGDQITFIVTVVNQGQTDAIDVVVEDYIPSYMTFSSSPDFSLNGASYLANIPFLSAGSSQELRITLELTSYSNLDVINNAEIISADDDEDLLNPLPIDQDSDLGLVIGFSDDNSEIATDNDIDDEDLSQPGTMDNPLDQDDYDPSVLPILDLANTKTVNAASLAAAGGTFEPNEIITFEINVFNQGNVIADNIVVTDTIPCGLSYDNLSNDSEGWILSGMGGSASYIVNSLLPGTDTTILIHFTIKPSSLVISDCDLNPGVVSGEPFTNFSFIKSADVDGVTQSQDVDSEFDSFTPEEANTNPNNTGDNDTNSTGNDQNGSQDDNDPALVEIFDLALSKIVSPLELPYQVGESATFKICVSNQGNVPTDSINIVDYIPAGLEYNIVNDALGWTGFPGMSLVTYNIDAMDLPGGTLDFGEQVCVDIQLTILSNQTDYVNRSEITSATALVDDGMGGFLRTLVTSDNDSSFDNIPADEAGGGAETESDAITNNTNDPAILGDGSGVIGGGIASTDDDSSDPALLPIVDFALRKKVDDSNIGPFAVGDTIRFLIEVLNQGNVGGSNITLNDYIPNNLGFVNNAINTNWTGVPFGESNATANATLSGPITPGEIDSIYIDLEILAGGLNIEDYTNAAEIFMVFAAPGSPSGLSDGMDITNFDVDSTPDADSENDNGSDASSPNTLNVPNPADDYVDGNGLDPLGMPDDGIQETDEDDADPAFVAFHDVALTKTKPVNQGSVDIGDLVTFTITVYNQGNSPLDSVSIIDYIPSGFSFTPNNNWITSGLNATLIATVGNALIPIGGIPVGGFQEFPIELTVSPTATLNNLVNIAEIIGSRDLNDLTQDDDRDSNADMIVDNDAGGSDDTDSDDEVNGDGTGIPGDGVAATDEDDSDPEGVELALYSIGNQVWLDSNYNGIIDESEGGIENVTVELYNTSGVLIGSTMTDDMGLYLFDTLVSGDYIVVIPASELAANGTLQDYLSSSGTFNSGGIYENPGVDAETNIDNDDNGTYDTNIDYPSSVVSTVISLGGDDEPLNENPDNDGNTLDRFENLTVDFGFIKKVYDVALIKESDMETGNKFGDDILFTITVSNQGNTPLTNIEVTDYIASGFVTVPALNDFITDAGGSGWNDNGPTSSTYVIGDTIAPNDSREIRIYLTLTASLQADSYINYAEVSLFQDTIGNSTDGTGPYVGGINDEDSNPDAMNDNDAGGEPDSDADDYEDGDGTGTVGGGDAPTDEDDHDPSKISVVDIALAKTVVTLAPYIYGQEVEFDIEVTNQGNVDLEDILITDYIPCGFILGPSNTGWNLSGSEATYTIPTLAGGETVNVSVFFIVAPVAGTCNHNEAYVNYAEVSQMFADYDGDGVFDDDVSLEDADSEADSDDSNDAGGQPNSDADDFVEGDGTGSTNDGIDSTDEDDHDPAFINIFDLAQIKYIDNEGPYNIGETATFEFEVTNQGNVDAYNIVVTDYLAEGFSFSAVGNIGWSVNGSNLVYTIDGPLEPGETFSMSIDLTIVLPAAVSTNSWYNESEIREADDNTNPFDEDPTDADSTPDDNPDNDNDLVDGPDDDSIFDPDDSNDNVIDENPSDPFGFGDDDEDDNDAAGIIVVGGIGDTVWKDENGNGIQDPGEPGVEGVMVTLTDCDGNFVDSQTTDADGFYFFSSLTPGDYQLQYDISGLPPGCLFTNQDQGNDDSVDSDVDENGLTPCTTIQGGEYDSSFDVGLSTLANIGDFVWHDLDGDGIQDGNEPGIPDVMVLLYNEDNELIQVTITDPDGKYLFTSLLSDTYYIVFTDPEGFESTFPNTTDDANDSDITNFVFTAEGSTTDLFTIVSGQEDDLTFDAGYYMCVPVGEKVWYDVNEDDIADPDENGINGLEVNLYRLEGFEYLLFETQLTDHKPGTASDDGYYKFCAPPGRYYIEIIMPPIGLVKAKANVFNNLPLTHPNESTLDSDLTDNFGLITTASFIINSGEQLCNIGAGFYPMANVGNRVWMDSNENGTQDSGEQNVPNVKVEAFEAVSGLKVGESTTNNQGTYKIEYLEKKDYYLKFSPPSGFGFTTPNSGDDDMDSDVDHSYGYKTTGAYSLEPGETYINIDAGLKLGALPLEWVSVTAEHKGTFNLVSWKTVAEVNTDFFVVEKSLDGVTKFEALGEVLAKGESAVVNNYELEDTDIRSGIHYYRIKQFDKDGKFEYSDIVSLKVESSSNIISLAPNPAYGKSILTIGLDNEKAVTVEIIGSDGRLIRTYTLESSNGQSINARLEIDLLPSGVYSIHINQGTFSEVKKLIVVE